jgi:hypothetical protein
VSTLGRLLAALAAFALLCATGWGILRTAIGGQYGFGMAYLAAAAVFFGVMVWLLAGIKSSVASQPIIVANEKRDPRLRWTPDSVIQLASVIAPAIAGIRENRVPSGAIPTPEARLISAPVASSPVESSPVVPLLLQAPPVKPDGRGRRGGSSGPGSPARFKKLEREFSSIQKRLGLTTQEARLMRARVFANSSPFPRRQGPSPYPQAVSARIVGIRIEFAKLIRPYVTQRPLRGADHCSAIAERVAPAVRNNNRRLAVLQIEQLLVTCYSVDELLVYCLHNWQFNNTEIADRLGISAFDADRALHDVNETITQIEEMTRSRLLAETGIQYEINLVPIFMLACTEWIPGSRTAKQEAS